jgi:hypothetical protein
MAASSRTYSSGVGMHRWGSGLRGSLSLPTEKAVAEYQRQQQGPTIALDVCWNCGTAYASPDDGCDA